MDSGSNLTNHFLIAMPGLQDSNFFHTVTYICEHNEDGAMGIVLNRPTDLQLEDILEQLDIKGQKAQRCSHPVYLGGPVQTERGFVLHTPGHEWDSTTSITQEISITTSLDILRSIADGEGPEKLLIALGYAGWAPGQLEAELGANAWLNGPADSEIIFEMPSDQRWTAAARCLGVDLNLLSGEAGHA
ncbi:MAG: YqgE/AlgH family protein [Gammaproteobacteria bacterium]|jgi:putative transcriptional regulator|nr:YqgE/AlgH family protein [Gammaproteobacteria bacterium]